LEGEVSVVNINNRSSSSQGTVAAAGFDQHNILRVRGGPVVGC
jgi:hypothetical protein